jgi:feruloyl esterase
VAITLTPTADSVIKAEVWLPLQWNGKFLGVGGGGFVGSINRNGMANAVREGYATASTDTGHEGGGTAFAIGHPEKVIDFAYRAVHEMTVAAKSLIVAHYGRAARLSYWQGCSTGGRQGLMSALRYPEDYDGIIAGAPANNQIELCGWRMDIMVAALKDPARALPAAKTALLNDAVIAACDGIDGVVDGLLEDPRKCNYDPAALLCKGAASETCLTEGELATVRMAYSDARRKDGSLIYPGLVRGGERGWLLPGTSKEPGSIDLGMFRDVSRQDPGWDWKTFDIERDVAMAQQRAGFIEARDTDFSRFRARGGKLLIYHGWSDGGSGGAISPLNSINYFSKITPAGGDWARLFMIPGMAHCGGGSGPNQFNALAAMERWREEGIAPEVIVASRVVNGVIERTRPLCSYPKVAVYRGSGSINDAGNFVCR